MDAQRLATRKAAEITQYIVGLARQVALRPNVASVFLQAPIIVTMSPTVLSVHATPEPLK